MKRSPKLPAVSQAVLNAVQGGNYVVTHHARQRMLERGVIWPEILQVLTLGHHEKAKDDYVERFSAWNYAIRGKTLDGRELRVAVGFEGAMLIITVVDLGA
ncbi:MAG: DUF4258 domain-containing protein [candidate division FCPU426 bacterium]